MVATKKAKAKGGSYSARELLARNLVELRAERGWSQDELAAEADVHRTYVAAAERQRRNMAIDGIERLARALQVPMARLFQD